MLDEFIPIARRIADALIARGETVAVADGATGGLISASLLAIPGASKFYRGGGVVYTFRARNVLFALDREAYAGMTSATETLCPAAGPRHPRQFPGGLGHCRDWRVGRQRASAWGRFGQELRGGGGAAAGDGAGADHRDRQRRPRREHAHVYPGGACLAGGRA